MVNGAAAPFSANNLFPLGDGVATGGNGGSGGLSLAPATTGQPGSNGSSKNVEVF